MSCEGVTVVFARDLYILIKRFCFLRDLSGASWSLDRMFVIEPGS